MTAVTLLQINADDLIFEPMIIVFVLTWSRKIVFVS